MKHALSRTLLVLALLATMSVGMAQGDDPAGPQAGYGFLVAMISGAVAAIRSTKWGSRIDGVVQVGALATVVGGALGVPLVLIPGFLWAEGALLQTLTWPLSGLLLGASAGINAVFGVSILTYLNKIVQREGGKTTLATAEILRLATQAVPLNTETPFGFVWSAATAILTPLGLSPVGKWLDALQPILTHWAQHPAVLTDDIRATIQTQVLHALTKAGLPGQDLL